MNWLFHVTDKVAFVLVEGALNVRRPAWLSGALYRVGNWLYDLPDKWEVK